LDTSATVFGELVPFPSNGAEFDAALESSGSVCSKAETMAVVTIHLPFQNDYLATKHTLSMPDYNLHKKYLQIDL
jgi:hypothetical protein